MINCPHCGNTIGERVGEYVLIRHKKRKVLVRELVAFECEQCGHSFSLAEIDLSRRATQASDKL